MEHEYAVFASDIVNKRFRMGTLNVKDAENIGMKIIEFMSKNKLISINSVEKQVANLYDDLEEYGLCLINA